MGWQRWACAFLTIFSLLKDGKIVLGNHYKH